MNLKRPPRPAIAAIWRRSALPGIFVLISVFYFIFDPAGYSWMPRCPFLAVTGWQCPGCGSQRLIHALLHLQFADALHANALLFLSLPYLLLWIAVDTSPRRRSDHPRFSPRLARMSAAMNSTTAVVIICSALIIWTVVRNLCGAGML